MTLLDPSDVIEAALRNTGALLSESGIQVERVVEPGLPLVAVRVPAHPVAQALLRAFGKRP